MHEANGDDHPRQADFDRFVAVNGGNRSITLGLTAENHDDGCTALANGTECGCETVEFSWDWCDICGSPLGGSRHAFTVWWEVTA